MNNFNQIVAAVLLSLGIYWGTGCQLITSDHPKNAPDRSAAEVSHSKSTDQHLTPLDSKGSSSKSTTSFVTGRGFLLSGRQEETGYGLYSYLLLGGYPADDRTRERYLAAIKRYLLLQEAESFPSGFNKMQVNITYLPIESLHISAPIESLHISADSKKHRPEEWYLENYDFARAQVLLRSIKGVHLDGPYIISVMAPLQLNKMVTEQYLWQDMSTVPPQMADAWIREFLAQTATKGIYQESDAASLAFELRVKISELSRALPEILAATEHFRHGLDDFIHWKH